MVQEIESLSDSTREIPIYLSRYGLRVWESPVQEPPVAR
jgi:hypothetical protein